jgi:hypothetical protein
MHAGNRALFVLSASFIVLAFVLRVIVPEELFVLWGRPWGSHYVHMGWLAFWAFLVVGLVLGLAVTLKIAWRALRQRL